MVTFTKHLGAVFVLISDTLIRPFQCKNYAYNGALNRYRNPGDAEKEELVERRQHMEPLIVTQWG